MNAAEFDLVVLGSGAAGMTAALTGAKQGLRVLLLEKTAEIGGTTAYSAGAAWLPCSEAAAAAGHSDSPEAVSAYMATMGAVGGTPDVWQAFLKGAPQVEAFLRNHSHLKFVVPAHAPDYREGPGAVLAGRMLATPEFDGTRLGADLALLRRPREGFTVLGDMQVGRADVEALLAPLSSVARFKHALRILAKHAASRLRHGRSTRLVMGNALVAALLLSLREAGVTIRTKAQVARLLRDSTGRVNGVLLADGAEIRARAGVVLATGGFGSGAKWREALLSVSDAGHHVGAPAQTGDGLSLATELGGMVTAKDQRSGAYWMPSSILERGGKALLFPHILLDRAKPGLIAVDQTGQRFVNEGDSYHDFCEALFARQQSKAWLVFDRRFLRRYGVGLVHPGKWRLSAFKAAKYLIEAADLQTLAAKIGVPEGAFLQTVNRYNDFASRGEDPDFGKGSRPLNRQNGDPNHGPNPCLAPLQQGPYYAVAVYPATLATAAGLRADGQARVLRADGQPIAGLYVAGNDMLSVMQGTYPGPGTTIGPAMVFGHLAALHAAGALKN